MAPKTGKQGLLRILAVDDDETVLGLYKKIFAPRSGEPGLFGELNEIAGNLFGDDNKIIVNSHSFELDTCQQAEDAVQLVSDSIKDNNPYFVIFLDMRMPPGPDGAWAAEKIRELDRRVNIVIVTGYSDVHPQEIVDRLGTASQLLYLKKPFYREEIYQLALSLSENWLMHEKLLGIHDKLEETVRKKTHCLQKGNKKLKDEIKNRKATEKELEKKSDTLTSVNTALEVLLAKRESDQKELEEKIMYNIRDRINPYISKLKTDNLTEKQLSYLEIIESNIKEMVSPFSKSLSAVNLKLTPSEIQVANLIKLGKSTKEISEVLHVSEKTVETYRKNIRKKLGLTNKKENLRTFLLSIN